MADTEATFEAACRALAVAGGNLARRKTAAHRAAYYDALAAHEVAAEACRALYEREARAATVARRLALVAPRRALRARQYTMTLWPIVAVPQLEA